MSSLTLMTYTMDGAKLGGENPLPPLIPYRTPSAVAAPTAGAAEYRDRGSEHHILPYRLQDQYDRELRPTQYRAAVLENEYLRATFLLELGGRLWSLFHKPSNRELLYVNPVLQPANLAVRDAWFAGGVEWNIGIIGHCPFTCSPLHAARVSTDDGTPVLRLYEFERIRGVPFQIDFYLPEGSAFLLVRPRIVNVTGDTVPMYWWSNIAVRERADVRILGPAEEAYRHNYDRSLKSHSIPIHEGVDITYATNRRTASDMYLRIAPQHRPWIAALDAKGNGLVQTSTARLFGRKAFNWGMGPGGRRWQEFLARPGEAYIEIQAGLARTQGEYVPMPPGAEWSWLEAYGLMEAPAGKVHGSNWAEAHQSVERQLETRLPGNWLDAELERSSEWAKREPIEILHSGSGWGALERHRRAAAGEEAMPLSMPFPDGAMDHEQAPWLELLKTNVFPERPVTEAPGAYMVQPQWRTLMEAALHQPQNAHWLTFFHLGVMRYRAGDMAGARNAWEQSMGLTPSAWTCRNLALLEQLAGNQAQAAILMERAHCLLPGELSIAQECCSALLAVGRANDLLVAMREAPAHVQQNPRVRLFLAKAALAVGDLTTVARFFEGACDIPNMREAEVSLSDLWFSWHEKRLSLETARPIDAELKQRVRNEFPPPARFDFRISDRDLGR